MKLQLTNGSQSYQFNPDEWFDISIPLHFNGAQPNHFGVEPAVSQVLETDGFTGDTRRGGSCNVEYYRLIPHCNGTHTECLGHITEERISIHASLKDSFIPSTLITVRPVKATNTTDSYRPEKEADDLLITRNALEEALMDCPGDFLQGLIIRTLPNDLSKKSRHYLENPPSFFSLEAMRYICELEIKHLIVDLPSVDRMFDEGKLSAHYIFWNIFPGSRQTTTGARREHTITELVYVPNEIPDGHYLVNIQIPNFVADAAPSRVLLFPLSATRPS